MHNEIRLYKAFNGLLYLRNELNTEYADNADALPAPDSLPFVGDWNGDVRSGSRYFE